jgi:hypothetical protein
VFENRVLRKVRVFGPQRREVKRAWRRLHSEQLYDLYCSQNTFRVKKKKRRIGCAVLEGLMGKERDTYRNLMGKPGRKNTLG